MERKLTRRGFLKLSGAGLAGATLLGATGCGGEDGGQGGDQGGDNTLEFWSFDEARLLFVKKVLASDEWKSKHPDAKVNFRIFPFTQMNDRLLTALVSGQGAPDIADVTNNSFARFITGDRVPFVPLEDRIGDEIDNLNTAVATQSFTWNDRIYGLGNELSVVVLAYRKDIMDKLGVKTPFETWDEVIEAGRELVAATESKMFAVQGGNISWGKWSMHAQNAGYPSATIFDQNGDYIADAEESVAALQFMHDLVYEHEIGIIAPGGGSPNPWAAPEYLAGFRAEQYIAELAPPWLLYLISVSAEDQAGKWTAQRLPEDMGGLRGGSPTANFGATAHCITEQSKNVDLAWDLVEACNLTVEGVIQDAKARGIFPTYKPAQDHPQFDKPNEYFGGVKLGQLYASLAPSVVPFYQSPMIPEAMEQAMPREVITPVMNNEKDAETALTEFRARVEQLQRG